MHFKVAFVSSCMFVTMLALAGCGNRIESEAKYPTGADRGVTENDIYAEEPSIFGAEGLRIFGGKDKSADTSGIGVNGYLWRAALDTVSFMPIVSADPFGGAILTDWYMPEGTSGERLKLNIFILDKQLRSDAIRVRVFRQVQARGGWRDAEADPATALELENAILTRARQLRIAGMN